VSKTLSDADLGFRALLTRAPYCPQLVASPSEYDAAPVYLTREYSEHGEDIKRELAVVMSEQVAEVAATNTLGRQAMIALQLAAPIGFGMVRIAALTGQLASTVAAFNPVIAILTVPALFFTAKKTLQDMRRAFVVDPKVRQLIERARLASDARDHKRAESLLKEALEVDIDPTYQRNGDLYLQLGLAQMADGRPRQALVSLARASVLFSEQDILPMPTPGGPVKVSKRGWTELLACAAIDSFAVDDPRGLDEWSSLVQDFARSAQKRFEAVATAREAGHLFGLFGVDQDSANIGRDLAAKARFLVAKMKLRGAGSTANGAAVDALIEDGLRDLDGAVNLTPEERFTAILQQAQFFARLASSDGFSADHAKRALRLMTKAAEVAADTRPALAARIRAEAAAFALEIMPPLVAHGKDVAALRSQAETLLGGLAADATTGNTAGLALAPVAAGWAQEQMFHLASTRELRSLHIRTAYEAYLQANEPVSALYCALRLAYLATDATQTRAAVTAIVAAGQRVRDGAADPVSAAFAARYVAEAKALLNEGIGTDAWASVAAAFLAAAEAVRADRQVAAFTVHGKPVIHPSPVADAILRGQAAQHLARAGKGPQAITLLEEVRASVASYASPTTLMAFELEHAAILKSLGHVAQARSIAETVENEARFTGDMALHRSALELLHMLSQAKSESESQDATAPEAVSALTEALAPKSDDGLLSDYARTRRQVLEAGYAVIEILRQPLLRDRFAPRVGGVDVVSALQHRLNRLQEDTFRLGIVGEFSSGKSTFINALLGDSVLPSSVRPTTSAPTRIRYGAVPALTVHFLDGRAERNELSALESYVTEKRNPGNGAGVSCVEIEYPSPLLARGVELLDTPGISSLIEAHKATTYEQIPQCDAIILLATGRQPFSESIGTFLEYLRLVLKDKVFYVINKIDQIHPERRQQSVDFARDRVAERVAGAKVFAISAYRALASRRLASGAAQADDYTDDPRIGDLVSPAEMLRDSALPDFETSLGAFLADERGIPTLRRISNELYEVVRQTEQALELERQASKIDLAKRTAMHRQLSADLATKKAAAARDLRASEAQFDAILSELETRARCEIPSLADAILHASKVTLDDMRSSSSKAALKLRLEKAAKDSVQHWAEGAIGDVMRQLHDTLHDTQMLLQKHRRDLRTHFASVVTSEGGYSPPVDRAIELDFEIDENTFGRFIVQSVVGFVGGFLLGIAGIFVAPLVGRFLSNLLFGGAEELTAKLRDSLRYKLRDMLEEVAERVASDLRGRLQPTTAQLQSELRDMSDGILAEFDRELSCLVTERETSDEAARDLDRLLTTMQTTAAHARQVLRSVGN
jgi:GTPase SAR1 family protein